MYRKLQEIRRFADETDGMVLVEVSKAVGSTPREAGAWMLVSSSGICGTIGGGQLEYMAVDEARKALAARNPEILELQVPLGPEIGQCCGGNVRLRIRMIDEDLLKECVRRVRICHDQLPQVYIFGAGHVGRALAEFLQFLPVHVVLVDQREDELFASESEVKKCLSAIPESLVSGARPGGAFVILTHDHALDFLIAREALNRGDAAYVGMIGSKSKRNTFRSWMREEAAGDADFDLLTCPIGDTENTDKRPEVIAIATAAQVMGAFGSPAAIESQVDRTDSLTQTGERA